MVGLKFNQKRALGRRCLFDIFYFHFTQKIEKIEAVRVTRTKKGGEFRDGSQLILSVFLSEVG